MSVITPSILAHTTLVNLSETSVAPHLPHRERMVHFLSQVKNPYSFCWNDTAVGISFSPSASPLDEVLKNYFIAQKQG